MQSFTVETTPLFQKEAKSLVKKYPSFKSDLQTIIDSLKEEPKQGTSLGRDCYKIRIKISSKTKGKSGGARLITCVKIVKQKVYLVTVYDKSSRESITASFLQKIIQQAGLE